jgi:hypothetical protein
MTPTLTNLQEAKYKGYSSFGSNLKFRHYIFWLTIVISKNKASHDKGY